MNNSEVRIYELAKELNLDIKEIVAICDQINITFKSYSSRISESEAESIRKAAEKLLVNNLQEPREYPINNLQQPREFDAVLGGQSPVLEGAAVLGGQSPSLEGAAVLGGLEGVKLRLTNADSKVRIVALEQALNYGEQGLDVVIHSLQNEYPQIQIQAYSLLTSRTELKVKQALLKFNPQSLKLEPIEVVTVNSYGEIIQRQQRLARYFTEDLGNGITLDMAAIPSGTFIMGAPETEERSSNWERPQHQVTIKPFFISKYPITEAQWKAVAALHKDTFRPLYPYVDEFQGENHPVTNIRFDDAVEFCNRLSNYTGQIYRLPSEAEWEYACRAGTNTPFYFGETITTDLANYDGHRTYGNAPKGEYRPKTTPVGSFPPNGFGLYDMHGNVREWCADRFYTGYHDSYKGAPTDGSVWIGDDDVCPVVRDSSLEEYMQDHGFKSYDDFCPVVRGGSRLDPPVCCRSACRDSSGRFGRSSFHGFRIVMIALGTL